MGLSTATLRRIGLLADLPEAALAPLAAVAVERGYADGETIVLDGAAEAPVGFVLTGGVRAYRANPDGREQTLIRLEPGEAFNLPVAFAGDSRAPATAVAIGPTRIVLVSSGDFRRVVSTTPSLALVVLGDLSDKLRHVAELAHELSLFTVRGRLAGFLLDRAAGGHRVHVTWTQEELAAELGTVREVTSRVLNAFARRGVIRLERDRITILDAAALEAERAS
ncbi:MAG: Crp/Fnr family transcriptional regulator [Candidatus Krumholzibacteriota bacterium]|nr:Crp/Fnr family transcriptional regulator [Candidatus Krumholzibacteriota bacterium]